MRRDPSNPLPFLGAPVVFMLPEGAERPAFVVALVREQETELPTGVVNLHVLTDGANDNAQLGPNEQGALAVYRPNVNFALRPTPGFWSWADGWADG